MMHPFGEHAPEIDPSAFVHPDATVIGEVFVHARASIWPGAILRGDMGRIVIGEDSNVQDGSIAHMTHDLSHCVIGKRVTVGHGVILHGCVVEDDCLIGMGAILLDNVKIGSGSLVAAGTLLTYGTEVPPNSIVMGSPGKVRGSVDAKARKMIDEGWPTYVETAKKYKHQLAMPR